jgi:2-hydroxycyclohexanecarboxyl-CoA dehydrogenase
VPAVRLEGKVAVVTGGAMGIGAATCLRLAAEGARVAVCDFKLEPAKEVAGQIDGEAFDMDVTDTASVRAAADAIAESFGPPGIVVNNAGTDEFAFFHQTDEGLWNRIIDVNLLGVLRVTHAFLPAMIEGNGGRIVNVASEAGRVGSNGSATYSAAKGGVISFTKAIARENARFGITCNAVAPGPVNTPLLNRARELGEIGNKVIDTMVGSTALRRMAEPEEIAAVIAFLASDDSSYVTGQALGVSGGLAMI